MSALARLRSMEISPKGSDPEPSKPTKPPFDGFVGTPPPCIQKNSQGIAAANDAARGAQRGRSWRIQYPNAHTLEVLFAHAATAEEVREVYADAAVEPLLESRRRKPTIAEAEELQLLIAEVLRNDAESERTEALAVAYDEPDSALRTLRTLRDELRQNERWLGQRYARVCEDGDATQ